MPDTALIPHQFTLESAIAEWLATKELHTGSKRTRRAYETTMRQFRAFLSSGGLDLLGNPLDIKRVATQWANMRIGERAGLDVSASTYNVRLAILSSFYAFLQEQYELDIPNPIKDIKKRPVQAYESAEPLEPDIVESGLDVIDRSTPEGRRDYAILAVAIATGRRVSEIAGLRGQDVKMAGKKRIQLTFHCKGAKVKRDLLDNETSAVLLDYLHTQFGKRLQVIPPDAPVWVSYSNENRGQAISTRTLSKICLRHLGTSKFHALRHTFSDGMIESGAPITELSERLGHTDLKITQLYTAKLRSDNNPYSEKITRRYGIRRRS
jgi:integrase